jgi:DNA replication protein DnaC
LSALYVRAPRLFEELNLCHADGSFRKRLAAIAKINVLLIDDFAIAPIVRENVTIYSSCSTTGSVHVLAS